jgi:hypothetical protein
MYCPRCATQNIDSARYCRSCGANLSLVPQALTGELSQPESRLDRRDRRRGRDREPDLARGIRKISVGLAFLILLLILTRSSLGMGQTWILIPAFLMLGKGIGEIVSARAAHREISPPRQQAPETHRFPPASVVVDAPPSVTENTTRRLDPDRTNEKAM